MILTMILHLKNLKNLFTRIASTHSYNTRSAAAGKFHVIHSWIKQQNQSFSRLGARTWNEIPELFKSKPKQLFKKHLQTKLLQFLVHEGVYFQLMSIILLINYSLRLPNTYVCVFSHYLIFIIIFNILCFIYLNCALPRLAMLFGVCSYTIFIFICE